MKKTLPFAHLIAIRGLSLRSARAGVIFRAVTFLTLENPLIT